MVVTASLNYNLSVAVSISYDPSIKLPIGIIPLDEFVLTEEYKRANLRLLIGKCRTLFDYKGWRTCGMM